MLSVYLAGVVLLVCLSSVRIVSCSVYFLVDFLIDFFQPLLDILFPTFLAVLFVFWWLRSLRKMHVFRLVHPYESGCLWAPPPQRKIDPSMTSVFYATLLRARAIVIVCVTEIDNRVCSGMELPYRLVSDRPTQERGVVCLVRRRREPVHSDALTFFLLVSSQDG